MNGDIDPEEALPDVAEEIQNNLQQLDATVINEESGEPVETAEPVETTEPAETTEPVQTAEAGVGEDQFADPMTGTGSPAGGAEEETGDHNSTRPNSSRSHLSNPSKASSRKGSVISNRSLLAEDEQEVNGASGRTSRASATSRTSFKTTTTAIEPDEERGEEQVEEEAAVAEETEDLQDIELIEAIEEEELMAPQQDEQEMAEDQAAGGDCRIAALQSLLQQRDAPPSSCTPRGDKPKHCGLCMSFGLRLQLKSQNTNGTISHRASPFISALLSRSRSARVREAVTAKFAAVHTSANTAAGTAVNAARRGP